MQSRALKQSIQYFIKAVLLVAVLFVIAKLAPSMPPLVLALVWAALSALVAIGYTYYGTIKKLQTQLTLKADGKLARLNEGRTIRLIISFVVAAILMAGLIFQAPGWDTPRWLLIGAAVPINYLVALGVGRVLFHEFEPRFALAKITQISAGITGVLLCVGYVIMLVVEPAHTFPSAYEAFMAMPQPFANSSSALLVEAGQYAALAQGIVAYGMAKVAEVSYGGYLIVSLVMVASAYFGFASLLSLCLINDAELKYVFYPLEVAKAQALTELADDSDDAKVAKPDTLDADESASNTTVTSAEADADKPAPKKTAVPVKRYIACACVLPVLLAGAYLVADAEAARVVETEEYSAAETFVREQVGVAAYVLDGKYYDQAAVEEILQQADVKAEQLSEDAQAVLVPLINEAFDQRIANVDAYLDWYYSLPADYERLAQFFTGTIEDGMKEQLEARINEGVDDTALTDELTNYLTQAQQLREDLLAELEAHELVGVPDWLIVSVGTLEPDFLDAPLEPTEKLMEAESRLGLSAGIGAISGFAIKKVVTKPFFGKIVGRLTSGLTTRGLAEAAGTTAGTVLSPGVGTAIGAVGGLAIGTLSDYLFLKADEALNREAYKAEIVDALEAGRAEMLAIVEGDTTDPSNDASSDASPDTSTAEPTTTE